MKKIFVVLISVFLCVELLASVKYDILVAQDGTGDFTTIQEAVNSVRAMMDKRKTIFVKNGVYHEKLVVPTHVINLSIIGEDKLKTVISWADHANMPIPGTTKKMGTFLTYTLLVQGHGFRAENITIENMAPELGQAVALHVEGDKAVFVNCRVLGFQDTIYTGSETSRQYYQNCYIEGTTDFIFGSSTAYFQTCQIHCKKDSYITAPSTPKYKKYGFVFNQCSITSDSNVTKVFLGRPWRPYGASVFLYCKLDSCVLAAAWDNWRNAENEKTARFYECKNTGPGSWRTGRASWARNLPGRKAKCYTPKKVLAGCDKWDPTAN